VVSLRSTTLRAQLFDVDAPAVVGYADRQHAGTVSGLDSNASRLRLAGCLPFRGILQGVVDGVAQDVIERCVQLVEDVAVHVGGFAAHLELNAFAELAGQIADQARKPLHSIAKRPHAAHNDLMVEPAIKIVRLPGMGLELLDAFGKQCVAFGQPFTGIAQQGTTALCGVIFGKSFAQAHSGRRQGAPGVA